MLTALSSGTRAQWPHGSWLARSRVPGDRRLARVLAVSLAGARDDGSLSGTGGSIAFVLAASVRAPLPGLAISNGLFPGLAGVVKTLADEHGRRVSGSTGFCLSASPPTGYAN